MRVLRGVRILVFLLVVALVVATAVAVLSARPDLQRAKRDVERAWTPLATDLAGRYLLLATAVEAVRPVTGPVHDLVGEVDAALARWRDAHGVATQVRAANGVEGAGARLVVAVRESTRVAPAGPARTAVEKYAADRSFDASAPAFDAAVLAYEKERRGPLRHVVAKMLGDGPIPAFATPRLPAP